MSTPILTLQEMKNWLPVKQGNTQFDDKINALILLATMQIETAISRKLTKQSYSVQYPTIHTIQVFYDFFAPTNERGVYRDARRQRIVLEGLNIDTNQPFTVWYDPLLQWTDDRKVYSQSDNSLTGYGDYILDTDKSILDVHIDTVATPNALRVDYTAGYAVDTDTGTLTVSAPFDLKMGCVLQVISLFNRSMPDNVGVDKDRSQGKVATGSFTTSHGLVPEAAAMVARYKPLLVGRY